MIRTAIRHVQPLRRVPSEGLVGETAGPWLLTRRGRHEGHLRESQAQEDNEFLMSLLKSSPSVRDSRTYLASFTPTGHITHSSPPRSSLPTPSLPIKGKQKQPELSPNQDPAILTDYATKFRRPALVKLQGAVTETQLDSVTKGLAYLRKLGLVGVIVVDRDEGGPVGHEDGRKEAVRAVEDTVQHLLDHFAPARPILSTIFTRPTSTEEDGYHPAPLEITEEGLSQIRASLANGEIPVVMPLAMSPSLQSRRVDTDECILALCRGMVASSDGDQDAAGSSRPDKEHEMDLTPVRLLIINKEGGLPSYARNGLPHLLINLSSEFEHITDTFLPQWRRTHPTSLGNLKLANECLGIMPTSASALVVSHKSPVALIGNLLNNKPTFSASLPHALLGEAEGRITAHTPTLIRKGLEVRVIRDFGDVDRDKLRRLFERSFGRKLEEKGFWKRVERDLDFLIVVGDYAGAALCTLEGREMKATGGEGGEHLPFCYLDKFAVLPSHQGDGTVDFLFVALRDETSGLGLSDAANSNVGSLSGKGRGRDLVWRSRGDNPVNKWYFERSNGFVRRGKWKMFWCDAEDRVREVQERREGGVKVVEEGEKGRLEVWGEVVEGIPSAWE